MIASTLALFSSLLMLPACLLWAQTLPATERVFPGAEWQATSPADQSPACRARLAQTHDFLKTLDTTALMAVQNGRVLLSYGEIEDVSIVFSVRKSVLAMMLGKHVANDPGWLEKTLAEIGIDDEGGLLPIERQASLRDLLSARSGVYHAAVNGGDDSAFAPARGSQIPGHYFLYNNWDFNAAGSAFEILTKRDIYEAFEEDLAIPLQLQDFDSKRHHRSGDPRISRHGAYHFFLSTRDMARLGYLMHEHGNWNGRQLMPASWVDRITTTVTPPQEMHPAHTARRNFGYGYLWWTLQEPLDSPLHGGYMAWGAQGQFILVIPRRRMVVAHKRRVPVDGNWAVSWVRPDAFLKAARMLASSDCE